MYIWKKTCRQFWIDAKITVDELLSKFPEKIKTSTIESIIRDYIRRKCINTLKYLKPYIDQARVFGKIRTTIDEIKTEFIKDITCLLNNLYATLLVETQ